jgi:small conductance mechanosensitive channel
MEAIKDQALSMMLYYGPRVLLALAVLYFGFKLVGKLSLMLERALANKDVDASLRPFLRTIVSLILKVAIFISVASMVGIETTSFVAVLGAAGLAVGLALQGHLANFAGGTLILLLKPYKVGDVIEAQGYVGKVNEIQIFNTILKTADNKTVFIPNGPLSNGSLINYSTEENRRVDLVFGIGYGDNIAAAREVILKVIGTQTRIFSDPEPVIVVSALADSSVNFAVRVWCKGADYWDIFFYLQEQVKVSFDEAGISIPFPQMDVHAHKVG